MVGGVGELTANSAGSAGFRGVKLHTNARALARNDAPLPAQERRGSDPRTTPRPRTVAEGGGPDLRDLNHDPTACPAWSGQQYRIGGMNRRRINGIGARAFQNRTGVPDGDSGTSAEKGRRLSLREWSGIFGDYPQKHETGDIAPATFSEVEMEESLRKAGLYQDAARTRNSRRGDHFITACVRTNRTRAGPGAHGVLRRYALSVFGFQASGVAGGYSC
jgi:hypothetical protein